jgi:hypothetical protein
LICAINHKPYRATVGLSWAWLQPVRQIHKPHLLQQQRQPLRLVFQDCRADGSGGGSGITQRAKSVQVRVSQPNSTPPSGVKIAIAPSCASHGARLAWFLR